MRVKTATGFPCVIPSLDIKTKSKRGDALILIFSVENEPSTTEVMRWLAHLGAPEIVRVNCDEVLAAPPKLYMDQDSFTLEVNEVTINMSDLSAVWYRKGSFWFNNLFSEVAIPGHDALTLMLNKKSRAEDLRICEYFHHLVRKNVRTLGSVNAATPNKLITLDLAREVGLSVPSFFISNQRHHFEKWLSEGCQLITKPASDGIYLWDVEGAHRGYFTYTEKLTMESLKIYQETLPLSFAQRQIEKEIEIRVFFLDGMTYSIAIFSQNDERTKVDYRKYNYDRPNRNVPFALPKDVDKKLCLLFKKLGLNTGSVDLMVDAKGEYFFLEINPTGQYNALSDLCNFNLPEHIARWLMGEQDHDQRN